LTIRRLCHLKDRGSVYDGKILGTSNLEKKKRNVMVVLFEGYQENEEIFGERKKNLLLFDQKVDDPLSHKVKL
jgi:hypothetical protein